MVDFLATALLLAGEGWHVFPLQPGGKRPIPGTKGVHDATTDPATILAWAAEHPTANVGLAPALSGHAVLDVDCKNGTDGLASLNGIAPELCMKLELDLPAGRVVRTPSGGYHVYFRTDIPLANSAGTLGKGLDVRGAGGYVVAPGSVIDGRAYELTSAEGPHPAPTWLGRPKAERVEVAEPVDLDNPLALAQAGHLLANTVLPPMGDGSDHATYSLFCRLRDLGIREETAVKMADEASNPFGHEVSWLAEKAANAYRYAQNDIGARDPQPIMNEMIAAAKAEARKGNRFFAAAVTGAAIDNLPAPAWAYENLIEENSLTMIRGQYGTKKTYVALDLALSASIGRDWIGHACTRRRKVLYCAAEGVFAMPARVKAWTKCHNGGRAPDTFTLLRTVPQYGSPEDWAAFEEYVRESEVDLIIVDTFARATAGLDENSGRDMSLVIQRCGQLQGEGRSVVLVAHEGKDAAKGSRMHTSVPAACDLELALAKGRNETVTLSMVRVKNAPEWKEPLTLRSQVVEVDDGETNIVLYADDAPETDEKKPAPTPAASQVAKDVAFAVEVREVLKAAAEASPHSRVRTDGELARAVMRRRKASGMILMDEVSSDYKKMEEALRKKLSRSGAREAMSEYWHEDRGGWAYLGNLDAGAGTG